MRKNLTDFVPINDRPPETVRAVILARKSKSGTESDVKSQVEECQQFIAQREWTLVAEPYQYAELGKSGRYDVVREVLDAVLLRAQRGEVDVIVAREPERLSRVSERRAFYVEFCRMYGVEWRFANLKPDGKLPDTTEGKIMGMVTELFGQLEAERIAERTARGQESRYTAGLPHGGRYGPPFGYKWRPKAPDEKTYSAYIEDPETATIVREIYTRFATNESTTGRSLAAELNRRRIPSPGGKNWSRSHLIAMLRNPIYCGRGRRKRWQSIRGDKIDEDTGRKNDYASIHNRAKDDDYLEQTYPLAEGAAPALVDPEVWDKAQQAIARNRTFGGKTGRKNSPHPEDATLLHGGYAFCAVPDCGATMTRHWRRDRTSPIYSCGTEGHRHEINAVATDRTVLRTVAMALTDPEQLLELADKAEQQTAQAADDVERASTELDVYRQLDATRAKVRESYLAAISALGAIPGDANRATIADLRAQLAQLDNEQAKATEERKGATPQLQHQLEAARRRAQILERLTWVKDKYHHILDQDGKPTGRVSISSRPGLTVDGDPTRVLRPSVSLEEAAEILGVSTGDFAIETGIPVNRWWAGYAADDPDGKWEADVNTQHVVYYWLYNAPHDYVRQLLRDLNVKVLIKPPRSEEERALHGLTPPKERVIVRFLADPNEATYLRPSDKKPHDLSSLSRW